MDDAFFMLTLWFLLVAPLATKPPCNKAVVRTITAMYLNLRLWY
jgi:hypothetical protein